METHSYTLGKYRLSLGTGRDRVISRVSSNNTASGIYLNDSVWSFLLVGYKKVKPKGREPTLEETRPDHVSYYQITARP